MHIGYQNFWPSFNNVYQYNDGKTDFKLKIFFKKLNFFKKEMITVGNILKRSENTVKCGK